MPKSPEELIFGLIMLSLMSIMLGALLQDLIVEHRRSKRCDQFIEELKDTDLGNDLELLVVLSERIGRRVGLVEDPDGQPHQDALFVPKNWFGDE